MVQSGLIAKMEPAAPANPGLIAAGPDEEAIIRGAGVGDDREIVSYTQLDAMVRAGRNIRKLAVAYHPPDARGRPGAHPSIVALPAEKDVKWFGRGYRPVGWEAPVVPEPRLLLPSMVEELIEKGEPVPEEMAPPGYLGPTYSLKERRAALNQQRAATDDVPPDFPAADLAEERAALEELRGDIEARVATLPVLHYCSKECGRFFDSPEAQRGHEATCKHEPDEPGD